MSGDHSSLAPSSASRWVHCPGSIQMAAAFPEDRTGNTAAEEGTAAHWVAQYAIGEGSWPEATTAPNGIAITEEMKGHLTSYVELVRSKSSLGIRLEDRLSAPDVHAQVWGTADAFAFDHNLKIGYLWDLKYGYRAIESFENWQLVAYAAGLMHQIGIDAVNWKFVLTIVQPRAFHREGVVRSWTATATQLGPLIRQLRVAAEEAMGNHPTATAGPHCKYCPAQYDCPASLNAAADAVETSETATPVGLTPAAMAFELRLLRRAQMNLENRLAAIEAQAMSEIRAGKIVPGWSIEHANGREEWVKSTEEVLAMGELFGVKLAKPDAITPAQARKAGMAADVVAQYSARKTGAAKLVPISTTAARKAFQNG